MSILRHWRIIAPLAALAGTFYAGWHISSTYHRAAALKAVVAAQEAAIQQTKRIIIDVQQSAEADQARRDILSADLAATDGSLDRLRADLAAIASGDTAAITSLDARAIAGLFAECAGEVVRLANEADNLAARVLGLQGYIRAIGVAE